MASFRTTFTQLCAPAAVYFVISMFALIMVIFQNASNTDSYHVGHFSCRVPNTFLVFVAKFIYVVFWTYVLNLICKDGHVGISWLLVLLPWLLLFSVMWVLMLNM